PGAGTRSAPGVAGGRPAPFRASPPATEGAGAFPEVGGGAPGLAQPPAENVTKKIARRRNRTTWFIGGSAEAGSMNGRLRPRSFRIVARKNPSSATLPVFGIVRSRSAIAAVLAR